jgi:hypothetical protein
MLSVTTKRAELARIHLAFAKAEIGLIENKTEEIERLVRHIEKADRCLKTLAPEFDNPAEADGEAA